MKVIDKSKVADLIKDNAMVAISGSGGSGSPEALLTSILKRYKKEGKPKNIGVVCGISPGNLTKDLVGMNKLSAKGLVGKAFCSHLGMGKLFAESVANNEFPAYGIPLGVLSGCLRASAAKEKGILTKVGLNTFADARIDGCCANLLAKKEPPIVKLVNIDNEDYLFYKAIPIDVALIKASYADKRGNISFEEEAVIDLSFHMASSAHNNGGLVIVEVKDIKEYGALKAKNVLINSKLVDYVVISKPDEALGNYNLPIYKPEFTGDIKTKYSMQIEKLDIRKICARRCSLEIKENDVVNLGVGMPDSVASVLREENILDKVNLSIECGAFGGLPIGGVSFGACMCPDSIISTADNFDLYNGGFLDMAILGFAEIDKFGNVNVSKIDGRITGPGGFINITSFTKKIIFMGSFTAKGLNINISNNKLIILNEGKVKKFKNNVEQITFNGKVALDNNQEVMYVTERAVFKLTCDGLKLIEVAMDIDIEKDILSLMEFRPLISSNLKIMDKKIFNDGLMDLIRI